LTKNKTKRAVEQKKPDTKTVMPKAQAIVNKKKEEDSESSDDSVEVVPVKSKAKQPAKVTKKSRSR